MAPEGDPADAATPAPQRLRAAAAAVAALPDPGEDPDAGDVESFDPVAHADRFAELHEALTAALADLDGP